MNFDFFKHLVTGKDNQTHDVARWSWLLTTVATIAGAAWNAVHANAVNLMEFAQAIGIISGSHGAAVLMKRDTEPHPDPDPKG